MIVNQKFTRRGIIRASVLSLASAAVIALAPASAGAQTQLKYASTTPTESILAERIYLPASDALNKEAAGLFEITHFPPPFADLVNIWDRLTAGVADLGIVSLNNTGLPLSASYVVSLPGSDRQSEAAGVALWRLYERGLLEDAIDEVVVLGFTVPMTLVLYTREPVASMDDLRGLRLRVNEPTTANALKAMGASPVSIPITEAYQSISRGVVDASIANSISMVNFRFRELLNHETTGVAFGTQPFLLAMNRNSYDNLSPEARAVIDSWRGEKMSRFLGARFDQMKEDLEKELIESGDLTKTELSEAEQKRWLGTMAPVTQAWIEQTPRGEEVLRVFNEEYERALVNN